MTDKLLAWITKNKKTTGSIVFVPLIIVAMIFGVNPKDLVYADLDTRYLQIAELQNSEQRILDELKASRIQNLESEIYYLTKLKYEGKATPADQARKDRLIRELNALRNQ